MRAPRRRIEGGTTRTPLVPCVDKRRSSCHFFRSGARIAMADPNQRNGAVDLGAGLGRDGRMRLLTGLRPTGKFHLGNYVGTFEKDLELQNDGRYECFFLVADYHTLTTAPESSRDLADNIREGLLD